MSTSASVKPENLDSWFESLADEAVARNNRSVCTWTKYKDDLEQTKNILSWLPNKLKHQVMVPIGSKALMRGKIVHTNELLVNLGETWFVKTSAKKTIEICDRRIQKCDEMLEKLKKEEELIQSKKTLPVEKEAFGSEERPEIVEYVSEQEHEEWKKQHKIKEREYRQKLAEMKNKERKAIETEEDLWQRLEELELREELEDELCRLNAEGDEFSEESDIDCDEKIVESMESDTVNQDISVKDSNEGNRKTEDSKPSVSFALDLPDLSDEPLRLEIKHSPNEPVPNTYSGVINSPSDIYQAYLEGLKPKSILKKKVNVNQEKEVRSLSEDIDEKVEPSFSTGIVLPDVVAKNLSPSGDGLEIPQRENVYKEPVKRISKFKASRMKKI